MQGLEELHDQLVRADEELVNIRARLEALKKAKEHYTREQQSNEDALIKISSHYESSRVECNALLKKLEGQKAALENVTALNSILPLRLGQMGVVESQIVSIFKSRSERLRKLALRISTAEDGTFKDDLASTMSRSIECRHERDLRKERVGRAKQKEVEFLENHQNLILQEIEKIQSS